MCERAAASGGTRSHILIMPQKILYVFIALKA